MRILALAAVILAAVPSVATAGIDLSWNQCVTAAPAGDITPSCAPGSVSNLYANFQLPTTLNGFVALDAIIDVELGTALPPFWHYETGGCNQTGLQIFDDRPQADCPSASNATPWGAGGGSADAFIDAYSPNFGATNRARLVLTVARASSSPTTLTGGQNYYGFHLAFSGDGSASCVGCAAPAEVTWTSGAFYSIQGGLPSTLTVTTPGLRSQKVTVNGGISGVTGFEVFSIAPTHATTGGPVSISVFGRAIQAGATLRLEHSGQAPIVATGVAVAPDGRSISGSVNLTTAFAGLWDAVVINPGGASSRLSAAFNVDDNLAVTGITPFEFSDIGTFPAVVTGAGFEAGAVVVLHKAGLLDLPGSVTSIAADGRSLNCTFTFNMPTPGTWDLVVTNPTAETATLAGGVRIVATPHGLAINPNMISNAGAPTTFAIDGSGLDQVTGVSFELAGQTPRIASAITHIDPSRMTATVNMAGAAPGLWDLVLTVGGLQGRGPGLLRVFTAPVLDSIAPVQAGNGDVFTATVYGQGFTVGSTAIDMTGPGAVLHATSVAVASDGRSATGSFDPRSTPAGTRNVVVITSGTISSNVLTGGFTLIGSPKITRVTPNQGPNTGVLTLRASGSGFQSGATASLMRTGLSDLVGTNVVVGPSDTSLTATFNLTDAAAGPWDFSVRNPNGLQGRGSGLFSVLATPSIDSIVPSQGPNQATALPVAIYGHRLSPSLDARISNTLVVRLATLSSVTPDGTRANVLFNLTGLSTGPYDFTVNNLPGGSVTIPNGFTVLSPPTITSVTPTFGLDTTAVLPLTVTGTRFLAGATVKLVNASATLTATNVQINPAGTSLTANVDLRPGFEGAWDVRVSNLDGSFAILGTSFRIDQVPLPVSIVPNLGADTELLSVSVFGSRFGAASRITLSRAGQPNVSVVGQVLNGGTRLSAGLDLRGVAVGLWNVTVTNATGTASGTLVNAFQVFAGPRITAISPAGSDPVPLLNATVQGSGFQLGAQVSLERTGLPTIEGTNEVTSTDGTQITVQFGLSGQPVGPRDVVVRNPDERDATLVGGFTVAAGPTIQSVTPAFAPDTGVAVLSLGGFGFGAGATTWLQRAGQPNINGTQVSVSPGGNAIQASFDLRGKALGLWDVVVRNVGGGQSTLPARFEILYGGPTFAAGLDLTWDACDLPSSSGSLATTFDCANPSFVKTLYANFTSPIPLPEFVALDAVIDIETAASSLPDFWHYDASGCNSNGLLLGDAKPASPCPSASNLNPWGTLGSASDAFITGYAPDWAGGGRARLVLSVVRASDDPTSIQGGQNYYGFDLTWTGDLIPCPGCTTPAEITWTSALLHSAGLGSVPVMVSGTGQRSNHVAVNGGLFGLGLTSVVPDRATLGGFRRVRLFGRNLGGVTNVALTYSGRPDIPGTAIVIATDARSLDCTFDLSGAQSGAWSVRATGSAGSAVLTAALRVLSTIPEVRVISPNGGEVLPPGHNTVLWEAVDDKSVTTVDLYINRNYPTGPYEILALELPNTGSATVTITSGHLCVIRAVAHDADGNEGTDDSDAPFQIGDITATLLAKFDAVRVTEGVEVQWRFVTPDRIASAQLERAPSDAGPWALVSAAPRDRDGSIVVLDRDPSAAASRYRLRATTRDGESLTFGPVGVEAVATAPGISGVTSIVPNPAISRAQVRLAIARETRVRVSVLDLQGREVAVLVDGVLPAGPHEIDWDTRGGGRSLPAGLYFVRYTDPTRRQVTRLALAP